MNMREYFEVHTNDCSNATFIADYETGELLYLNQAMEKKFQIFEDYTGKFCEDIIPYYKEVRGYGNKEELKLGDFLDRTFLCEMLNCNLRSKTTLLDVMGRQFIQTKYFLAPTTDKRQEAENVFEKSIALCLEILNDNQISSPINAFLKLLGEFYACDLSYIMEFDGKNEQLYKSHIWSLQQRMPEIKDYTPEIPLKKFVHWLQNEQHKSIINLDQSEHYYEINTVESMILQHYHIQNITLCKLWNKEGTLTGILGISNRADLMYDDRLLQAVSHFVMEQFNKNSMVEALEELNDIDLLTGFYTRRKYQEKIAQLEENPPKSLGVLFVNLNGLRTTNEYLGYEAGDEQLKKTASLLNEYFNSSFYRITGDEFVGFVPNCDEAVFEETVESIQTRLKNQHSEAAFSLGHSWESGSYTISNLIKIADTIMVINKQAFYHETLRDMEKIQNTMLQDLFRGIDQNEFLVYLQPQVDLCTEKVVAAEALIRRQKPDKMIFPDQFIPLYEENNIIRHVDLFVVRKVCKLLAEWKSYGKEYPISVNLSRVTLTEHGIVDTISEILDEFHIPHHLVIIEITERIGVSENDVAATLVDEFKANGYKLSLDDFGCAYSNIVTLAKISVDEVKIDKSLVDHVLTNEKNKIIVESMLTMCSRLPNTHTLAEGIENKEQAEFLRNAQCHYGQGYYYSRPIPNEEFFEKYVSN